jgi:hypothetical protein
MFPNYCLALTAYRSLVTVYFALPSPSGDTGVGVIVVVSRGSVLVILRLPSAKFPPFAVTYAKAAATEESYGGQAGQVAQHDQYCLLLTDYRLLLTAYCLLLTDYRLPHTAYCLPITDYRLPLTAYCLPLTAYRLPHTAYRLLLTAYRLLLTAHRLLRFLPLQGRKGCGK